MSDEEQDMERIDKALAVLGEHFDTVQIFATRFENDVKGTYSIQKGTGNWYARYGQVVDWVGKQDEYMRENVRHDDDG